MPKLTIINAKENFIIEFDGTPTIQEVLEANGFVVPHPCGGNGICGKCAVEACGALSALDEKELALGCRLSCRTRLYGDAIVRLLTDTELQTEVSAMQVTPLSNSPVSDSPILHSPVSSDFRQNGNTPKIGAVVDIGTTTVALAVYDLQTGNCLTSASALNPQSTIAADVIGRIDYAVSGRLQELSVSIHNCIENLALSLGYAHQIDKWVMTGNTTMLYLLMGFNPVSLSASPFKAEQLFGIDTFFEEKPLYLPPCMHAFVGADTTCAVLASGMCDHTETSLLCDVGTNGEIALWKDEKLYVTSTAAGPAFEGAGISCGCQSVSGAIEHIRISDNYPNVSDTLEIQTIGGAKPIGLCGSGIIDAIACLLMNGTIDKTGAIEDDETVICENVTITQQDIRAIQLAKAAICAGIKTLLQITDTNEEEITHFYLAGGFGSHIDVENAARIGLFPASLCDKTFILGNAALKGAATMLTSEAQIEKATAIAAKATCINLGGMAEFNQKYIEEMMFP